MTKKITGIMVIGLLSVLTVSGYWLTATTSGLRFVLDMVVYYVPLPLTYTELQGSITTSIRAKSARYETESVSVVIQDFETEFALRPLLVKKIDFSNVGASHVEVVLAAGSEENDQKSTAEEQVTPVPQANDEPGLPVSIAITQLNVKKLTVRSPNAKPVVFDTVSIDHSSIKNNFQFTDLSFQHELGQLAASGVLGFSMNADLNLKLTWAFPGTKTLPAISGDSTIAGNYRQLNTSINITKPQQLTINVGADNPFDDLKWRGTVTGSRFPLSLINPDLAVELKELDFGGSGTLTQANIQGNAFVQDPDMGDWKAKINAEIGAGHWILTSLELNSQTSPTRIQMQGKSAKEFDYTTQSSFEAQLSWNDIQWPFVMKTDTDVIRSGSGQARWTGSLAQYQVELVNTDLRWQDHEISAFNIKASGNLESLEVSSYNGRYLNGSWNGSGAVRWDDGVKWKSTNRISRVDSSLQWPQWPALLSGTVSVNGRLTGDQWSVDGNVSKLSGKLRGIPIDQASFQFKVAPNDYRVRELIFKAGKNRLTGAAQINIKPDNGTSVEANWDIDARNLSRLFPNASGEFYSKATFGGTVANPELKLTANAKQLVFGDYGMASMTLDANINGKIKRTLEMNIQVKQARYQTWQLQQAKLGASGTLDNHNIKWSASVDDRRNLTLQATGKYTDKNWSGQLITADIVTGTLGNWYLARTVALEVSDQKLLVKNGCFLLRDDPAQTCISVTSDKFSDWQGKLTVSQLSANRLKSYFPQMLLETKGVFNGEAMFDLDGININVLNAELTSKRGALIYGFSGTEHQQFNYEAFSVSVLHTDRGLAIDANVDLKQQGKVKGNLLLKDKHTIGPLTQDQYLQGRMILDLNDLAILHLVYPEVQFKDGSKYSEFKVEGSLGKPVFIGYTTVKIKTALIPRIGVELNDVTMRLDYDEQHGIKAKGRVSSGDGFVNIEGQVKDFLAEEPQASMSLKGEKFRAINTAEITADVSPDLDINFQNSELKLRGALVIPSADVKMLESPTAVAPSGDVVYIDEQKQSEKAGPQAKPMTLDAEVRIKLGDFIRIQGFGAKGKLRGEVVVREDKSGVTKGSGEVYIVDGKYNAYGRELTIKTGKLIYTSSPVDNPLVDIKAQRKINDDVVVGVDVSGYAQNPKVTLFSEPTMDNADVLSYMMLGYPISQASEQDGATLASAAGSIGLVGGELLAKNIAKEFGIDEVEVKSDTTTQQTSLVLGKYLSPRLYAQYAVGIGEAVNAFRLEYQLTKQWVLKTESTEMGQSTDLLFTIEQ